MKTNMKHVIIIDAHRVAYISKIKSNRKTWISYQFTKRTIEAHLPTTTNNNHPVTSTDFFFPFKIQKKKNYTSNQLAWNCLIFERVWCVCVSFNLISTSAFLIFHRNINRASHYHQCLCLPLLLSSLTFIVKNRFATCTLLFFLFRLKKKFLFPFYFSSPFFISIFLDIRCHCTFHISSYHNWTGISNSWKRAFWSFWYVILKKSFSLHFYFFCNISNVHPCNNSIDLIFF